MLSSSAPFLSLSLRTPTEFECRYRDSTIARNVVSPDALMTIFGRHDVDLIKKNYISPSLEKNIFEIFFNNSHKHLKNDQQHPKHDIIPI